MPIFFKTVREILHSDKSIELKEISSLADESEYWIKIFNEIFTELSQYELEAIQKSILRISEIKKNKSITNDSSIETCLLVRLNSNSALTRFKMIAPHVLRNLNKRGHKIKSLKPSIGYI